MSSSLIVILSIIISVALLALLIVLIQGEEKFPLGR